MERKFTDDEIVKALGCCGSENCRGCPYRNGICHQGNPMIRDARDLIIRQKAEIERLTVLAELGNMRANDYRAMRDKAKNARAEAIKEFAERLKAKAMLQHGGVTVVYGSDIDNLVKEMTEEGAAYNGKPKQDS